MPIEAKAFFVPSTKLQTEVDDCRNVEEVRHKNAQVKFEFGYGPLILDRVTPLELRKKLKFSVYALQLLFGCMYKIQIGV